MGLRAGRAGDQGLGRPRRAAERRCSGRCAWREAEAAQVWLGDGLEETLGWEPGPHGGPTSPGPGVAGRAEPGRLASSSSTGPGPQQLLVGLQG